MWIRWRKKGKELLAPERGGQASALRTGCRGKDKATTTTAKAINHTVIDVLSGIGAAK